MASCREIAAVPLVAVNHVTPLLPVCSQRLTGLKAIHRPAALLETDVVNERETRGEVVGSVAL